MDPDFVAKGYCTIFWLNRGFREYLNLHSLDFQKKNVWPQYFFVQNTLIGKCFWSKKYANHVRPIVAKKI